MQLSGRPIIALDGCALHCARHILKRHGLSPDRHYDLSKMGVKKIKHEDFNAQEAAKVLENIAADVKSIARSELSAGVSTTAEPHRL